MGLVAGAVAASVRGSTLLVRADRAEQQLDADATDRRVGDDLDGHGGGAPPFAGERHTGAGGAEVEAPAARRFYATIVVDPARLPMEAARINTEVLAHLNALDGAEMEITIEVRATRHEGFPDETVRIVGENAAALRFRDHGFETS